MALKRLIWIIVLGSLIMSCSTGRFPSENQLGGTASDKGVAFLLGRRIPKNNARAFYYFHQAALQGDPLAQNEVAFMYAAGKGTSRDYKKALFYYQKAADHGLASAQFNLGLMYLHGMGAEKNKTLALKWIAKSAANGFEPARATLSQYSS